MTKQELQAEKMILITYLKLKMEVEDWHGVADTAMDIREVEAKLLILEQMKK